VDERRDRFEKKVAQLKERFRIEGWKGPFRYTPKQTDAKYPELPPHEPSWMVYMEKRGLVKDFHNPSAPKRRERVKFLIPETDMDKYSEELLALKLAIGVAGRAAHDSLDGTFLDDEVMVSPHSRLQVEDIAPLVLACLLTGAGEEDD